MAHGTIGRSRSLAWPPHGAHGRLTDPDILHGHHMERMQRLTDPDIAWPPHGAHGTIDRP